MESQDIATDEKYIESDVVAQKEDVEMKYEINEDQKPNHEKGEQQQLNYHHHGEPSKTIDIDSSNTNHEIHKLEPNLDAPGTQELALTNTVSLDKLKEIKHAIEQEDEDDMTKEERIAKEQRRIEQFDALYARYHEHKMHEATTPPIRKSKQNQDVVEEDPLDQPFDDTLMPMRSNRRIRQKNRYFLDFHCVDLTKGARSNKDGYEGFTTTTGTRSSNRRSTTDSNRGQQDETDGIESRYCRKCSTKTMHDVDGGCQPCLYKKIVESSKRQKPNVQRGRSNNSRHNHAKQKQQQSVNEAESSSNTTNVSKRKATKQGGSKINGNNSNLASNINNISNNNNTSTNVVPNNTNVSPIANDESIVGVNAEDTSIEKLPKLDSWTPDEVAEYILSKGFTQEAELFKMQSVDGISLLLMQRTDFTYGLKIKLGPALKIYDQVCKLKKEYFRSVAATN